MDFTESDGPIFPLYIHKGGEQYGFCPSKATWDTDAVALFNELLLTVEMKQFPSGEPMNFQDYEFVDNLSWFLPRYETMKFSRNIGMIFGSSDEKSKPATTPKKRSSIRRQKGRR